MASFLLSYFLPITVAITYLHSADGKLIDLSHDHSVNTVMSTNEMPRLKQKVIFDGELVKGVFAKYGSYSIAEHGGTHIDAPRHFQKDGYSLEKIPLENTIGDGVMIDCTEEVANNPDYALTLKKVNDWEKENGRIPQNAAVVINYNWSQYFNDPKKYFYTNNTDDANTFRYPTVTNEAIDFLVDERDIKMLAIDSMGPDLMTSKDFHVHSKILSKNRMVVENLKDPGRLPAKGFRLHASPVKFVGGTGVQVRVYAMVGDDFGAGGTGRRLIGCSGFVAILVMMVVLLL